MDLMEQIYAKAKENPQPPRHAGCYTMYKYHDGAHSVGCGGILGVDGT